MDELVTLYRPTGHKELSLIKNSKYKKWPPRLPEQPIFYPVTNEKYAIEIAKQWNTREKGIGYVARFHVRKAFMDQFQIQRVGASYHTEYWIPSSQLEELNNNIVGVIEIIHSFSTEGFDPGKTMNISGLVLMVPDKTDIECDAVASVWEQNGGEVLRLGRFWDPPSIDPTRVRVYGNDSFCLVLQQKLGLHLCSPPDDLLLTVHPDYLKRRVTKHLLGDAPGLEYPAFIKSLVPKLFASRVYASHETLITECHGLDSGTEIMVSEVVQFSVEARAFVYEETVLDCSIYEGSGDSGEAKRFIQDLTHLLPLPRTVVVDVGFDDQRGWSVLEFNAAWGAGLNGCRPELVWPCIAAASETKAN